MDLTTTYMGLTLKHPLVPSASPLSRTVASIERLAEAGASAVVLYSLFEEQIRFEAAELNHYLTQGTDRFAEALDYYPPQESYALGPDAYLEHIRKAKSAVDVPIIASLNCVSAGGWIEYARQIEQAGADGIELNLYYIAANPNVTGAEIEQVYLAVVKGVKAAVGIPVAVKLSPFFSATANAMKALDVAGADALVLFNRFYQPIIDVEQLEVRPDLVLSTPYESRLPIRWAAILSGQVRASIAVTSGISTVETVVQALMAGADVTQLCSALLRDGPAKLTELAAGLAEWLEKHEYDSVARVKGILNQEKCPEPAVFERANYMRLLNEYRWPGAERVS